METKILASSLHPSARRVSIEVLSWKKGKKKKKINPLFFSFPSREGEAIGFAAKSRRRRRGWRDCAKGAKRGGWSCRTGGSQPVSPCIWETAMHLCMFCGYRMLLANNAPFYVAHDSRLRLPPISFFHGCIVFQEYRGHFLPLLPHGRIPERMLERRSKPIEQEVGEGVAVRNSFRHRWRLRRRRWWWWWWTSDVPRVDSLKSRDLKCWSCFITKFQFRNFLRVM